MCNTTKHIYYVLISGFNSLLRLNQRYKKDHPWDIRSVDQIFTAQQLQQQQQKHLYTFNDFLDQPQYSTSQFIRLFHKNNCSLKLEKCSGENLVPHFRLSLHPTGTAAGVRARRNGCCRFIRNPTYLKIVVN